MGFHWQWLGVKKTGPGVVSDVLKAMGFEVRETKANLTLNEIDDLEGAFEWGGVLGGCEFRGWTFFTGSTLLDVADAVKVAAATGADACFAFAESTVGELKFQYAKPDGTFRSRRHFVEEPPGRPPGAGSFGLLKMSRAKGATAPTLTLFERKPRRWGKGEKFVPRRLSESETMEYLEARKGVVKEESEGTPLPGEPLDVQIDDHEPLVQVLAAIGFPASEVMSHFGGTYDWQRMQSVPGIGANERAFTAYIRGARRDAGKRTAGGLRNGPRQR